MKWWKPMSMLLSVTMSAFSAQAADLDYAPPHFESDGVNVPIDIESVSIHYTFDYAAQKATGDAKITFTMGRVDGFPLLDLLPKAERLTLNGVELPPASFAEVSSPDGVTRFRVLKERLAAGSVNELTIVYDVSREVTFQSGAAKVGFFMSDLSDRTFFEQFGPANMEFDRISFDFTVAVIGTEKQHALFANGDVVSTGHNSWTVKYPDYFDSSSLYFHLSAKDEFKVKEFVYDGIAGPFPVTIYARDQRSIDSATTSTLATLGNLEAKLGPYAHDKLVIYVAGLGGMEYCGATMTSVWALPHELTHSWFARGVMPSGGNSGWIDEAIASWQDDGFGSAGRAPNRAAVNLGNFSPYRRDTTDAAYTEGKALIAEFDFMFQNQGGMLPVLRSFYSERKLSRISVEEFHRYVEDQTNSDLQAIFDRYVYGKSTNNRGETVTAPEKPASRPVAGKGHPRPYTREELVEFR